MADLTAASQVFFDCSASRVSEVLRLVAQKATELGLATDEEALLEALKDREAQGTTGLAGGFAIPHAKSDAVVRPALLVLRFRDPIEWPSMDGVPVTCAIALLVPASGGNSLHLRLLSKLAVMLMDEGMRARIAAEDDPEAIAAIVNEGMAGA